MSMFMDLETFVNFNDANNTFEQNIGNCLYLCHKGIGNCETESDFQRLLYNAFSIKYSVLCEFPTRAYATLVRRGKEDNWSIDIMLKDDKHNRYIPIEVKFNEDDEQLVLDDITKVKACLKHLDKVSMGVVLAAHNSKPKLEEIEKSLVLEGRYKSECKIIEIKETSYFVLVAYVNDFTKKIVNTDDVVSKWEEVLNKNGE